MTMRMKPAAVFVTGIAFVMSLDASPSAQHASLSGRWTLNRELSQFPRELGFGADLVGGGPGSESTTASRGRGRGRTSPSGAAGFSSRRESEEDARRTRELTAEVRNPPAHLTITETPAAVTVTDDRGQSRTFHPDGKQEVLRLGDLPVAVMAKWESDRLVVAYRVEEGRELRYIYGSTADPPQLSVEVHFIERGGSDSVKRVYEPSGATETASPIPEAPHPAAAATSQATGSARPSAPGSEKAPASTQPDHAFAQQPGAELKGLNRLGLVVEDLGQQAVACGLNQSTLESSVSKSLSDAGLTVLRNTDEDTYVYVSVITARLSTGFCVSRYDTFLYTHTTARLSYQNTPVLVQVSLLHKGGIAGGASATHADDVLKGVKQFVDQFVGQIRDANK
jgi:hypothetical protein